MSIKISALTAIASIDDADLLAIVDSSASTTNKVTIAALAAAIGSGLPDGWTDEGSGHLHGRTVEFGNGAALLTFDAATKTITRDSGSFTDDGFVIGDIIVVDGSVLNDGAYTVANITGGSVITVVEALVNEGPIGSTNIYLYTQAALRFGPTNGSYPSEGQIQVDAQRVGKLIVASYSGGTYDILQVNGPATTLGDTFPDDATLRLYCGSDGFIQLTGGPILLSWLGSYPADDFIGSSAVLNSNFYLNWRDGSSGGVGAGRGIFALGKRLAAPSGNPTNAAFISLKDPTTGGLEVWFPSGNKCVIPDFNGSLPTSGGGSAHGASGNIQTSDGAGGFTSITPGSGIAALLATPSSANLRSALTDEIGTGALFFGVSPEQFASHTARFRNFRASPWTDTVSLATMTEATNPPTAGATLNGQQTADFDGTNDRIADTANPLSAYVTAAAGTVLVAFNADAAAADAGAGSPQNNPLLFGDIGPYIGVGFCNAGVRVHVYDGAYKSAVTAASTAAWHLAQMRWNGTNVEVRVDSGSWVTTAAGNVSDLTNSMRAGMNFNSTAFFNGRIAEILTFNARLSDDEVNALKAYLNTRYGQAW